MTGAEAARTPLHDLLTDIIARYRDDHSGEVATYIPELGRADPNWFGACLVTADGAMYEAGDSGQEFTIQSISKPFVYGMALEKVGRREVRNRVGVEPSGDAFNSISLRPGTGVPLNPMINAGAIAVSSLIYNALNPDALQRTLDWFSGFAGRPLAVDDKVYQSESATGHRNRAIAHLLRNFGVINDPVEEGLDLYFKQCSILTTCHDLAVMAATLANHGINPITRQQVMSPEYVEDVLSVMTTCGMYNYAGEWLYEVGVPAKSGVSGGIMAVLPGRMGIATFSPRLDAQGNSVRGIKACQELSSRFGLHLFNSQRTSRAVVKSEMTLEYRASSRVRSYGETQQIRALGNSVVVIELQGDLHFSSMEIVQRRIWRQLPQARVVLLDVSRVDSIDAPALESIEWMIERVKNRGAEIVFTGIAPDGRLRRLLLANDDHKLMFADLDSAIEAAEESLLHNHALGKNGRAFWDVKVPFSELDVARNLDNSERVYLERLLVGKTYQSGECICRKGDPAGEIFFLTEGAVSVRLYNSGSTFQRLAVFTPGSIFGEVAAIDRGPRSADVWADSPVQCLCLSLKDFDALAVQHPSLKIKLLQYLLRILTTRLRRSNDLIGQLSA
jgi:glutaminase